MDPGGDGGGGLTATTLSFTSCGTELPPDSRFCNKCGTPITPASLRFPVSPRLAVTDQPRSLRRLWNLRTLSPDRYCRLERFYRTSPINEFFQPQLEVTGEGSARIRIDIQPRFLNGVAHFTGQFASRRWTTRQVMPSTQSRRWSCPHRLSQFISWLRRRAERWKLSKKVVGRAGRTYFVEAEARCGDRPVARGSGTYVRTSMPRTSSMPMCAHDLGAVPIRKAQCEPSGYRSTRGEAQFCRRRSGIASYRRWHTSCR